MTVAATDLYVAAVVAYGPLRPASAVGGTPGHDL